MAPAPQPHNDTAEKMMTDVWYPFPISFMDWLEVYREKRAARRLEREAALVEVAKSNSSSSTPPSEPAPSSQAPSHVSFTAELPDREHPDRGRTRSRVFVPLKLGGFGESIESISSSSRPESKIPSTPSTLEERKVSEGSAYAALGCVSNGMALHRAKPLPMS